jgi:hypothetical protein
LIKDYRALYAGAAVGGRSAEAVNHLMALYASEDGTIRSVPLSEYVLFSLRDMYCNTEATRLDCVTTARATLPNNPSWQGWVTELEIFTILEVKKTLRIHYNDDKNLIEDLQWIKFMKLGEANYPEGAEYETDCWMVPETWNQAL